MVLDAMTGMPNPWETTPSNAKLIAWPVGVQRRAAGRGSEDRAARRHPRSPTRYMPENVWAVR